MAVDERRFSFMTKTQHYRKVTKPLLERKRRARMNLYIDELKDLIVDTMEAQGEQVAKWEKADILEMTVNYLKMQKHNNFKVMQENPQSFAQNGNSVNYKKFRDGYTQAAYDVSKIFSNLPGLDYKFATRLMQHLGGRLKDIPQEIDSDSATASTSIASKQTNSFPSITMQTEDCKSDFPCVKPAVSQVKQEVVWRPW